MSLQLNFQLMFSTYLPNRSHLSMSAPEDQMKWYNHRTPQTDGKAHLQREGRNLVIVQGYQIRQKDKKMSPEFKRYTQFNHYLDFCSWERRTLWPSQTFYEVIFGFEARKPFFDVDIDYEKLAIVVTEEQANAGVLALQAAILRAEPLIKAEHVMIFASHRVGKLSFHVVVDHWCVSDHKQMGAFFLKVQALVPPQYHRWMDGSIYGACRDFRVLGSHKCGSDGVKELSPLSTWVPPEADITCPLERKIAILGGSMVTNASYCKSLPDYAPRVEKLKYTGPQRELAEEQVQAAIALMPDQEAHKLSRVEGTQIRLRRASPSHCPICRRVHDHNNIYLVVSARGEVFYRCHQTPDGVHSLGMLTAPPTLHGEPAAEELPLPVEPIPASMHPGLNGTKPLPPLVLTHPTKHAIAATVARVLTTTVAFDDETPMAKPSSPTKELPYVATRDEKGVVKCNPLYGEHQEGGFKGNKLIAVYPAHIDAEALRKQWITSLKPISEWHSQVEGTSTVIACGFMAELNRTGKGGASTFDIQPGDFGWTGTSPLRPIIIKPSGRGNIGTTKWKAIVKRLSPTVDLASDSGSDDEKEGKSFAERVWDYSTLTEAIRAAKPREINAVERAWAHRPSTKVENPMQNMVLWNWQQHVNDMVIVKCVDRRRVTWVVDPTGGIGKSDFVANLTIQDAKRFHCVNELAQIKDAAEMVKNALNKGWLGHCMLIDIPRQTETRQGLYQAIECIKNGVVTTVKYSGGTMRWTPGHVVVFANYYPNVDMLSHDRWNVLVAEIPPATTTVEQIATRPRGELVRLVSLPIEEVRKRATPPKSRLRVVPRESDDVLPLPVDRSGEIARAATVPVGTST